MADREKAGARTERGAEAVIARGSNLVAGADVAAEGALKVHQPESWCWQEAELAETRDRLRPRTVNARVEVVATNSVGTVTLLRT